MNVMLKKIIQFYKRHATRLLHILIVILSVILVLLALSLKSAGASEVCFSELDAERILLDLERNEVLEGIISYYEKLDDQYSLEIRELNDHLIQCEAVLEKGSDLVLDYDKLIGKHEDTAKKVERQNFWSKIKTGFVSFISGVGTGILVAIILI